MIEKTRPLVLVIMGSVRRNRVCPAITAWVLEIARATTHLHYELVDLAGRPLPMDDEPSIPALAIYEHEHTRAWSRTVASADAIVFVTPQYNWGYPAVLKNAIDHLYTEWRDKPVVIISYGGHGGGKAAAQLLQIARALKMRPVTTMPEIVLTDAMIHGGPVTPAVDFTAHANAIRAALAELAAALSA